MKAFKMTIINYKILQRSFLMVAFWMFAFASHAITYIWTGSQGDQRWSSDRNWSPFGIPQSGDDVILSAGAGTVVYTLTYSTIKSLVIYEESGLVINSGKKLQINNSASIGVYLYTKANLEIRGTLEVLNTTGIGLSNSGVVSNLGQMSFNQIGTRCINSFGEINNYSNGKIYLDDAGNLGIGVAGGVLTNEGEIRFIQKSTNQGLLIFPNGKLQNNQSGNIYFGTKSASYLTVNGLAVNYGNIEIASTPIYGSAIILFNPGRLINEQDANISITGIFSTGINLNSKTSIENNGTFLIDGRYGGNIVGMRVKNDAYMDNVNGSTMTFKYLSTGINLESGNPKSLFYNYGTLDLSYIANYGIYSQGDFRNSSNGRINYNQAGGLFNGGSGVFLNGGGNLSMPGTAYINNSGSFTNTYCSDILLGGYINNNGSFQNFGFLSNPTSGAINTSTIDNFGIIHDPYSRFANSLNNQGVRIKKITGQAWYDLYEDVLDVGAWGDYWVEPDWYTDSGLNTPGAYYDDNNNTLNLDYPNAIGITSLYARFSYRDPATCSRIINVPFSAPIQGVTSQDPNGWSTQREAKPESTDLSVTRLEVFPNPSKGLLQIQLPQAIEGEQEIRVLDVNGRTVWQKTVNRSSKDFFSIDLSGHLNTGLYVLQVWQNGQMTGQQRLAIQIY